MSGGLLTAHDVAFTRTDETLAKATGTLRLFVGKARVQRPHDQWSEVSNVRLWLPDSASDDDVRTRVATEAVALTAFTYGYDLMPLGVQPHTLRSDDERTVNDAVPQLELH